MISTIKITAMFQMLALEPNYTYAQLHQDLDVILASVNYTVLF